jgi:hypothetical protein
MKHNSDLSLLKNKVILLISPQPWGSLYISKNHYAVELAKSNIVYYLCPEPLEKSSSNKIKIKPIDGLSNLFVIEHKLFFSFKIKFHLRRLFHFLMLIQTKRILKKINRNIDIVWSFDLGNYFPFTFFSKVPLKIFHPVDEPLNKEAILSAKGADVIFSVTHEILSKYQNHNLPSYFINHGVEASFIKSSSFFSKQDKLQCRVGFSGNLRRKDIDREILLTIINDNPNVQFDCWGDFENRNNLRDIESKTTDDFINELSSKKNVHLHGLLKPSQLADAYQQVDAFLICYDVAKDQSKGTNYHKVLEFVSTGKIIISNNVTTYQNFPELVQMVNERTNNKQLPTLFKKVINNITQYNSIELQKKRVAFASENTYQHQINRIDNHLISLNPISINP